MNENNNFDSKKIIEEINKLENDEESKNSNFKSNVSKFFEKALLTILFILLIIVIGSRFLDDTFSDLENYSDSEYSSDYSSDYYSDTTSTEDTSSTQMTIEEFLDSDLVNKMLAETVQDNTVAVNEVADNENTVEELTPLPAIDENSKEDVQITVEEIKEEPVAEYDEETVIKQSFEAEKKNFAVTDEGKTINGELIVGIENKNNDFVYELSVYTVFYKEKEIVNIDMQAVDIILANNKKYLKIVETPENYDSYEVFVSKYSYSKNLYELQDKKVTIESYVEDELIEIKIYNSGPKVDKVNLTILYYDKDGKILDIDEVADYNISKYWAGEATGYGVWDEANKTYIDYDNYKVILDYAGSYKY